MSGGGHFGYSQYHINQIADQIEEMLDRQGKDLCDEDLWGTPDYYELNPEQKVYPIYPDIIQNKMREAIKQLRIAAVYAQRVDWFLSGNDGEESFIERLSDELKELE